jgi:hypothetical protein
VAENSFPPAAPAAAAQSPVRSGLHAWFKPDFGVTVDGGSVLATWTVSGSSHLAGRFGYFVNSLQDVRFGQVFAHPLAPVAIQSFACLGGNTGEPFHLK